MKGEGSVLGQGTVLALHGWEGASPSFASDLAEVLLSFSDLGFLWAKNRWRARIPLYGSQPRDGERDVRVILSSQGKQPLRQYFLMKIFSLIC